MEEWRPVVGYEGLYEVSSEGRVRSLDRTNTIKYTSRVMQTRTTKGKLLTVKAGFNGYALVGVKRFDEKHSTLNVHRLVAMAFLDNPHTLRDVNHKNFDKVDNRVENLEWCSHAYNCQHARAGGRVVVGSAQPGAKLNEEKVKTIRRLHLEDKIGPIALGKQFGVCHSLIVGILQGRRWKHID